jgi:hypothetical protein
MLSNIFSKGAEVISSGARVIALNTPAPPPPANTAAITK